MDNKTCWQVALACLVAFAIHAAADHDGAYLVGTGAVFKHAL
jgi:hypothetical protein